MIPLFYLLVTLVAYSLFIDLVSNTKDHIVAFCMALLWPAWMPLMFVFISLAILKKV